MKKRIMIDPGHGMRFTGAIGDPSGGGQTGLVAEKDLNLAAANMLWQVSSDYDIDASQTRITDMPLDSALLRDLRARCKMAGDLDVDCFVSIHCNSAENKSARGFEIWTSIGETRADGLAESIFNAVSGFDPTMKMRADIEDGDHDREKHLYVLDHTPCPAVLLELGFMSNTEDLAQLIDKPRMRQMMIAVAGGIDTWFNAQLTQ